MKPTMKPSAENIIQSLITLLGTQLMARANVKQHICEVIAIAKKHNVLDKFDAEFIAEGEVSLEVLTKLNRILDQKFVDAIQHTKDLRDDLLNEEARAESQSLTKDMQQLNDNN